MWYLNQFSCECEHDLDSYPNFVNQIVIRRMRMKCTNRQVDHALRLHMKQSLNRPASAIIEKFQSVSFLSKSVAARLDRGKTQRATARGREKGREPAP